MARERTAEVRAPDAADWALSRGVVALTGRELATALGVPEDQVRRRLHAPARRGEWVMPVRGLWVPVPPEFRTWGAPPGIEIVDEMMRHLDVEYYVGWLTAASLHGAAHQAPQVFQVAVSRPVRDRTVGRTRFEFAQRQVAGVPTVPHPTRSGTVPVSSAAATMLDIAAAVRRSGGIENAATVIIELADLESFQIAEIVELTPRFPAAAGRRIGWILERFAEREDLEPLRAQVVAASEAPSRLDPSRPAAGPVDQTWMVHVNRDIEPDA